MDACAPIRVTEMAAALQAKAVASKISSPCDKATTSAPLNVSPAAVVSTAVTGMAGICVNRFLFKYKNSLIPQRDDYCFHSSGIDFMRCFFC